MLALGELSEEHIEILGSFFNPSESLKLFQDNSFLKIGGKSGTWVAQCGA